MSNLRSSSESCVSSGRKKALLPYLGLLAFVIGGLAFAILAGRDLWIQNRMLEVSRQTQGVIRTSEAKYYSASTPRASISYAYTVGAKAFFSRTLYPGSISWTSDHGSGTVQNLVREYQPGRAVPVYYDPTDPATSFLIRRRSTGSVLLLGIGSLFAMSGSIGLLHTVAAASSGFRTAATAVIVAAGQVSPWLAWHCVWQPAKIEPPFWPLAAYWLACWVLLAFNLPQSLQSLRELTLAAVIGGGLCGVLSLVLLMPLFALTGSWLWLSGSLYFGIVMAAVMAVLYLTGNLTVGSRK